MTPERHRYLKERFLAACELEGDTRAAYLARACPDEPVLRTQIEALLAHDAAATEFMRTPVPEASDQATISEPVGANGLPERIGRYRILGLLGEGGMGMVYLAEQANPRRTVALKVLKPGVASSATIRRFEHEAQVLARLHHPGIAQIIEAGLADGTVPFFAMERVEGRPLLAFARERGLGIRQRLDLLMRVCDAVHHAHQNGVIHRDLKPANILVQEGTEGPRDPGTEAAAARHSPVTPHHSRDRQDACPTPKILDFGVARLMDPDVQDATQQTHLGQLIGTMPYMSPEQATGDSRDVDCRADVYALGVIGYELISGRLPYPLAHRTLPEAIRIVREQDPTPLSDVDRVFRGDLDTILAKALEKDRTRRYASAADLASDIRRYLRDEPILARPAGAVYQFRKFARRRRGLVGGGAAVLFTLTLGMAATAWQSWVATRERDRAIAESRRAAKERDRAESEAAKARETARFIQAILASADPAVARGRNLTVRTLLDDAARRINFELKDQPDVAAALHDTIGTAYHSLGMDVEAETHCRQALSLRRQTLSDDHPELAGSMYRLATVLRTQRRFAEAEALIELSLATARRVFGEESAEAADILTGLAILRDQQYDHAAAEQIALEALRLNRKLSGREGPGVAASLGILALIYYDAGDYARSESSFRDAVAMRRRLFGDDQPALANDLNNLALLLRAKGDLAQAGTTAREAVNLNRRVRGADHPDLGIALTTLALIHEDLGDRRGAAPIYDEALGIARRAFGEEHLNVAHVKINLATCYYDMADYARARSIAEEGVAVLRRMPEGAGLFLVNGLNILSYIFRAQGDLFAAEQVCREALDLRKQLQPGHPDVADSMIALGKILMEQEDFAGAERFLRGCVELRRAALPPGHWTTANAESVLGGCLASMDRDEEAEPLLVGGALQLEVNAAPDHAKTREAHRRLFDWHLAHGDIDQAAACGELPETVPDSGAEKSRRIN